MAGPGRGRRKPSARAWVRRRHRAGVTGSLDPCPAAQAARLERVLPLSEPLLPRVLGVRRESGMGVRQDRGLSERPPSCLAASSGACARAPGEERACGAQHLNGALGSRRTGWISCSPGGTTRPSPDPGSEAGDASREGVQELPEPPLSGAERVVIRGRRRAGLCVQEPKDMLTLSQYHQRVHSQGQQLQHLQAELDKLHKEVSSVRAVHSERVAKLVFQRLNEDFVRKPDYALSSVGASIDLEKTSSDYEDTNTAYFWNRLSFWNYARPPSVILEPDVFPGNCWAFEGDQGQVVIRLPGHVQLSDITLQHPPPTVAHTGGASSAPRDFAVFGLQVDDKTEVFLGKFVFDVQKSEIQTFHLENDPPSAFPKVKIQILSNWGHPRFTCLYRVRAHGVRTSEWAEDNATEVTGGAQ
ncbi:sperm-associated antigen 4 protein isoform X3 [Psammomys obesus]|uniref:sperm-associated antigen 4 protein isoform X3 n=1 Tax=Psammomys obesus TaxID=48139 RepID=UPI0024534C46|nr:sperm-associated antigen 4 protein isoform X3 [Psammomys obesus]